MAGLGSAVDDATSAAPKRSTTHMASAARLVLVSAFIALGLVPAATAGASGDGGCGARQLSQPFLPWLDPAHYFLLPGGDFESNAGWTFGGRAQLVPGNEPFQVHLASDARSLRLSPGAWARSASTCVDSDELTIRFFARNGGSVLSSLAVEARVHTTALGKTVQTTVPVGVVLGTTRSWQPSLPAVFGLSVNQLLGGTTTVDFRIVPVGLGGDWYVDDVYVDPIKDY
jgi:hypothetical protein